MHAFVIAYLLVIELHLNKLPLGVDYIWADLSGIQTNPRYFESFSSRFIRAIVSTMLSNW
jgi:hypothetical protein